VATAALVALTYLLGLRWFGRRAGFYAACALALSPLVLGTARQMTMDLHQSLWFAVAMACFYFGYMSEGPRGKRWYHGMWAACGLGYLSKSVPGLFPLFLAFVFVCVEARGRPREIGRRIAEARVPVGLLLMLAITVPWHVLAYRSAGFVFYQEYFLHHHVDLLTGKDFSHGRPASYYLPSLLWGMFPWSLFLPMALVRAWRGTAAQPGDGPGDAPAAGPEADQARRFVLVWAAGLVLMFTAMSSKLHSYLLPMYPAAALLVGDWLAGAVSAKRWRALALASGLAALAVTAASVVATVAIGRLAGTPREAELHETISDLALHRAMASAYLLAAGLMLGAVLIAAARRRAGVVTMIGTLTVFTGLLVAWMLPALNDQRAAARGGPRGRALRRRRDAGGGSHRRPGAAEHVLLHAG